jgi:hypothetical protein
MGKGTEETVKTRLNLAAIGRYGAKGRRQPIRQMCVQTVQALRIEANWFAHILFIVYGEIEKAMTAGHRAVEDPFRSLHSDAMPSLSMVGAILCKLRQDGFIVRPCEARQFLGKWRISWK